MTKWLGIVLMAIGTVAVPVSAGTPDLDLRNNIWFDAAPRGPIGSMEHLKQGEPVFIEGSVVNRGDGPADGVVVEVRINGQVLGRENIGIIRRGMDRAFSIRWVPEAEGTYRVRAIIDPDNVIRESRENNNNFEKMAQIKFLVVDAPASDSDSSSSGDADTAEPGSDEGETATAEKPDLRVVGLIGVWPRAKAGKASMITVTIENRGAAASAACSVEIHVAGSRHASRPLARLRAGERATISASWTPERRGAYHIKAIVDAGNRVRESDESNNDSTANVEALPR